jgi:hypothetical protein
VKDGILKGLAFAAIRGIVSLEIPHDYGYAAAIGIPNIHRSGGSEQHLEGSSCQTSLVLNFRNRRPGVPIGEV